jgi:hypothetical protein
MALVNPKLWKQRSQQEPTPSSSSSSCNNLKNYNKHNGKTPPHSSAVTTPPLTPLSPEEQAALIRSLPFLFNVVEPVDKIDLAKTQSVLDKLQQAEYDNESVSSEADRCSSYHQRRHGSGNDAEREIQDKLQHFWSNHRGMEHSDSSDDDDDDDNNKDGDSVSISSADSSDDDSGLFRY